MTVVSLPFLNHVSPRSHYKIEGLNFPAIGSTEYRLQAALLNNCLSWKKFPHTLSKVMSLLRGIQIKSLVNLWYKGLASSPKLGAILKGHSSFIMGLAEDCIKTVSLPLLLQVGLTRVLPDKPPAWESLSPGSVPWEASLWQILNFNYPDPAPPFYKWRQGVDHLPLLFLDHDILTGCLEVLDVKIDAVTDGTLGWRKQMDTWWSEGKRQQRKPVFIHIYASSERIVRASKQFPPIANSPET